MYEYRSRSSLGTSGQGSSDAPNWPQVGRHLRCMLWLSLDLVCTRSSEAPTNWPQWLQNYLEDNYGVEAVQGADYCAWAVVWTWSSWAEYIMVLSVHTLYLLSIVCSFYSIVYLTGGYRSVTGKYDHICISSSVICHWLDVTLTLFPHLTYFPQSTMAPVPGPSAGTWWVVHPLSHIRYCSTYYLRGMDDDDLTRI